MNKFLGSGESRMSNPSTGYQPQKSASSPLFWNPSTGRLCTAAQLIEWYHQPMTEDEKRHGFPYQGGFAGG